MTDPLPKLIAILGPILLALFVVLRLPEKSNKQAEVLEEISSVLLPLVVLNVVRRTDTLEPIWSAFGIGFLLPVIVYLVVSVFARFQKFSPLFSSDGPINRLLLSSFGGGNRGNLLILTAFGTQAAIAPNLISQFVYLDLGNFLCLLTLGFLRVSQLSPDKNYPTTLTGILRQLANPGVIAAILVFLQLPGFRENDIAKFITTFDPLLNAAGPCLNFIFSFCIFLSIFIRVDDLKQVLTDFSVVISFFILSRIAAAIFSLLLLYFFGSTSEIYYALVILILMPPSSYLWQRISRFIPQVPTLSKRQAIYLLPNLIYFVLLAGAFLLGLYPSFSNCKLERHIRSSHPQAIKSLPTKTAPSPHPAAAPALRRLSVPA